MGVVEDFNAEKGIKHEGGSVCELIILETRALAHIITQKNLLSVGCAQSYLVELWVPQHSKNACIWCHIQLLDRM